MSKTNDRLVFCRPDGRWANKRSGATRTAGLYLSQQSAVQAAKRMLRNSGGGELTVKDLNGKIRSKDTIPPGNDPHPPKDKEH